MQQPEPLLEWTEGNTGVPPIASKITHNSSKLPEAVAPPGNTMPVHAFTHSASWGVTQISAFCGAALYAV